jgi:hypothetical protein
MTSRHGRSVRPEARLSVCYVAVAWASDSADQQRPTPDTPFPKGSKGFVPWHIFSASRLPRLLGLRRLRQIWDAPCVAQSPAMHVDAGGIECYQIMWGLRAPASPNQWNKRHSPKFREDTRITIPTSFSRSHPPTALGRIHAVGISKPVRTNVRRA